MGPLHCSRFSLQIGTKREPTSGLEPLTCSLRVIGHALQEVAQPRRYRISKGFSLPRLAVCCTVLRSRWYQSGVKQWIRCRRFLSKSYRRSHVSHHLTIRHSSCRWGSQREASRGRLGRAGPPFQRGVVFRRARTTRQTPLLFRKVRPVASRPRLIPGSSRGAAHHKGGAPRDRRPRHSVTLMTIVSPPPPSSSVLLLVVWCGMWQ
jgi:hypothetical protein